MWLDMDLYKRVRKLAFLEHQFQDNIIASPGPFHIVLCALRCLGASSGLDMAWIEASGTDLGGGGAEGARAPPHGHTFHNAYAHT